MSVWSRSLFRRIGEIVYDNKPFSEDKQPCFYCTIATALVQPVDYGGAGHHADTTAGVINGNAVSIYA